MSFPDSPLDLELTVVNGITYEYSAAKTAWIRRQVSLSNITFTGNVTANRVLTTEIRWAGNNAVFNAGITYRAATTPAAAKLGDQWYNTANDVLYEYITDGASTYWVDIQSLGTNAGNAVTISLDDLTLGGNIIVTSNLAYSIGGDTGRLRHIYAGNVTTVTANATTINAGNVAAGNITLTANLVAGNIGATGNIVATGNVQGSYMLGDGSQLTNLPVTGATTGKAIAMAIVFGG
jgi:hypothetical protein